MCVVVFLLYAENVKWGHLNGTNVLQSVAPGFPEVRDFARFSKEK